jgi:hypothetical protein
MVGRLWAGLALMTFAAAWPAGARGEDAVATMILPARGEAWTAARPRLRAIGAAVANRLGLALARDPAGDALHLSTRLAAARQLAVRGALDPAAAALDQALADAAAAPEQVADAGELVSAHLRLAGIALARGEQARARELLARLYRYHPALALSPVDATPQLQSAFAEVKARLGPDPALEPADLGARGRDAPVLVVARLVPGGLELSRYDRGMLVARAMGDDASVVAALAPLPARALATTPAGSPRRGGSVLRPMLLALGAAALGGGIYFAVLASSRADRIAQGCSPAMPCSDAQWRAWGDDYDSAHTLALVLVPAGAVAIAAGAAWYLFGARGVSVSPTASGAMVNWRGAF